MGDGQKTKKGTKMKTTKSKKKVAKANAAATVKSAVVAEPAATAPKVAVNIKRERCDIETSRLLPAPWNPRGEISPESVADLVSSIATVGVIEPIVAMPTAASLPNVPGPVYIIIAGHRRVKAAKLAGLETVPCDILKGIDAATAKRMTFIENLQRKDADPLLESNLVAELVADGMTIDEIAAEIGRDRKWVLRRKNLAQLSPSWRKRVASGEKMTTDCLEHIAAYPEAIQERLKKASAYNIADGTLHWSDIRRTFEIESRELKDACFDCSKCYNCAKNSGNTPDLFDWVGGKNPQLGRCLDAACFKRRMAKHVADTIEAAKASGVTIVKSNPTYSGKKISPTKTSKCNTLYTWEDYDKITHIIWSEPPRSIVQNAASAGKAKLSAKEIAERKETRERNKAIRKLADLCAADDNLARWLKMLASARVSAPFVIQHLFSGIDSYRLCGCDSEISKAAFVYFLGSNWPSTIPESYWKRVAEFIITNTNPSRNNYTVALFPDELRAVGLTDEEANHILTPTAKEELAKLSVKWGERANEPEESDEPGDAGDGADGTDSSEE